MISAWMLHTVAVAALLGVSALALERVLSALGRPSRWAWAGALALSVLLPALVALLPRAAGGGAVAIDLAGTEILAAAPAAVDPGAPLRLAVERALAAGWLLGSAGVLAALALAFLSVERERGRWRHRMLAGRAVLVSETTGPAVTGFLWPEIVVPRWALDLDEGAQRLLLAHEREHLRAGDPHLLLAALGALALMPWNIPLWWQVRRLRLAVEVDCDARVLRGTPRSTRAYGLLLLEVGRRASRTPLPAAALGEPRSLLERRIRLLADPRRPGRRARLALALAAAAGVAVACELPDPARPELDRLLPSGAGAPPAPAAVEEWKPTQTPYTDKPELIDREEFGRMLEGAYPRVLRDAGIGGTVVLWVFIGETGEVAEARVSAGSGYPGLDEAARRALLAARFSPARNEDAAVPVWIQLPVVFQARETAPERVPVSLWTAPRGGAPPPTSPTPVDARPELRDPEEIGGLLDRLYPPALRAAGIGGTVVLWVHVDPRGGVRNVGVARTSGRAELDAAAREVMSRARFIPPRAGGRPVDAWIQVPVSFGER